MGSLKGPYEANIIIIGTLIEGARIILKRFGVSREMPSNIEGIAK